MNTPKTAVIKLTAAALAAGCLVAAALLPEADSTITTALVGLGTGLFGWVGFRRPGDCPVQ